MKVRWSYDAFRWQAYGGISRYASELHRGLVARGVDSRVLAGLHRNRYLAGLPGVVGIDVDLLRPQLARQALTKGADRLFERIWAPVRDRGTIYHKTYYDRSVPVGPTLAVTVYDMVHERFPDQFGSRDFTVSAKRAWCERSDVVFTISERTRDDLLERIELDPARVVVTPLGVVPVVPDPTVVPAGGRPFVLYVGGRSPRYKNFRNFARAYARSEARRDSLLVCFGGGPFSPAETALLNGLGLADTVFVSGPDEVLAAHYAAARAFVYPSQYEGFGLPPLEAMSHGCPTAVGNCPAVAEAVGDAAELFDPDDVDAIAHAVDQVVGDDRCRSRLIAAGEGRVRLHSWERTVDLTIGGYERALA